MRKAFPILILGLGFLTLSGAVGVHFWDQTFHPAETTKKAPLPEAVPADLPGWTSRELPLGATESVEDAALKRLNFTDYVYRAYTRGDQRVSVYIAYWEPLQMPVRQVGSHTPDVCWVRNGWECTQLERDVFLNLRETPLKSTEKRAYRINGSEEYVLYWHLINGKVYKANNQLGMWDRWNMLHDHFRFGLNQKPEQYFVRINSNRPIETLWNQPTFQQLMQEVVEAVNLSVPQGENPEDYTLEFSI